MSIFNQDIEIARKYINQLTNLGVLHQHFERHPEMPF